MAPAASPRGGGTTPAGATPRPSGGSPASPRPEPYAEEGRVIAVRYPSLTVAHEGRRTPLHELVWRHGSARCVAHACSSPTSCAHPVLPAADRVAHCHTYHLAPRPPRRAPPLAPPGVRQPGRRQGAQARRAARPAGQRCGAPASQPPVGGGGGGGLQGVLVGAAPPSPRQTGSACPRRARGGVAPLASHLVPPPALRSARRGRRSTCMCWASRWTAPSRY